MRIKVIVNPNAGKKIVQRDLERIIGKLLIEGTAQSVDVTTTTARGHARRTAAALKPGEYHLVIACGGDGTINEVVNGLMESSCGIPLAILAAGTSNDFAYSLRLPDEAEAFCAMVRAGRYRAIDIGRANNQYFINVAAFGMFTDVAHKTDQEAKNLFGKLAYYIQGLKDAPEQLLSSIPLKVSSPENQLEGEFHLCLIANSMSVGSMRRLMLHADVSDGLFDVLLIKKKVLKLPFADMISGLTAHEIGKDPLIIYFQTSHIEFDSPLNDEIELDLDGEVAEGLPLVVDVVPRALQLMIPYSYEGNMEII